MEKLGGDMSHSQFEYHELPREKGIDDLIRFIDRVGASEIFNSEENIRSFVDAMEFEDFEDLIFRVNGILTQQPIGERGKYWNMRIGSEIGGIDTVDAEDKPRLLRKAWLGAKALSSTEDAGLVSSCAVNLVHPFVDGNGRTSRFMYELFKRGYNGTDEDRERLRLVLDDSGGLDTHDLVIPVFINRAAWSLVAQEGGGYPIPEGVSFGWNTVPPIDSLPIVVAREDLSQEEKDELVVWLSSKNKQYEPHTLAILNAFKTTNRIQEVLKEYTDNEKGVYRIVIDGN